MTVETPDNAGAGAPEAGDTTQPSIDLSPVLSRVEELAGQVGQIGERFQQWEHNQEPEPEPEQDYWQQLLGEPDPEPEPDQQRPALNPDMLRQAVMAELAPLQAEVQQLRNSRSLDQLLRDHPELKDPEVQAETGRHARDMADKISQQYGPEVADLLTDSPQFIALVRKAMVADQYAAGEVPAGGDAPTLESAGNANPAGGEQQPSIVAQVLANRRELPKGFR